MSTLRRYATPLAIIAAVILFYIEAPCDGFGLTSLTPSKGVENILTLVFWILALIVIVALFADRKDPGAEVVEVEGPAFTRYLFSNTRAGVFWLPIRIFLGFSWIEASLHKIQGTGWLDGGAALQGYWAAAVVIPEKGRPPISFEWYRQFIQTLLDNHAQTWFAPMIAFGEMAVGIGLLVGALVGVAAFFGALMNMSFLLAGSASTNPVLFTFAIGLILAWRVAGYYGLDRFLLPKLGVPWRARVATRPGAPSGA